MTIIHSNRQNFWITLTMLLLVAVVSVAVVQLIVLYNRTVSLARSANGMREAAKRLETENSELKTRMFAFFTPDAAMAAATERGLTADKAPEYSPIISAWVAGSSR